MVYEDLRQPLLEDLYRHSVEQARLGPVLERLDDALGALCEATPKELHAGGHHALIYWCVTCSRIALWPDCGRRALFTSLWPLRHLLPLSLTGSSSEGHEAVVQLVVPVSVNMRQWVTFPTQALAGHC